MPIRNQAILLVAILDSYGHLSILLNPEWRYIVASQDLEYLEALLEDLKVRVGSDARGLFVQLSSLNVGPLVTLKVETYQDANKVQQVVPSHFKELR